MQDRDFDNYQRILSGYPLISYTLLGIHITVTIAGLAGLFALMRSEIPGPQITDWAFLLALLMTFVTTMLWLMWFREHVLKDQAVAELQSEKIRFPSTPRWARVVTTMHAGFYFFGVLFWAILATTAAGNPQCLLQLFGR